MTACLQTILLRMAQADLQLVQTVVDDEGIDRSEHIHPQDERRLMIELPAIEYEHVAVGYVDANELQRPDANRRSAHGVTGRHIQRNTLDLRFHRVARVVTHE